jgi:thiosulfate reductase cytochrome b subunit
MLVIPVVVISGLLYMFYRYPQNQTIESINVESLELIAVVHTAGAILLIAFLITHLYLITTGTTPTSNLKAMLTGYEELEEEDNSGGNNYSETKVSTENPETLNNKI